MSKVTCAFCKKERQKSNEHIWPQWLLDYMAFRKGTFVSKHLGSPPDGDVLSKREQSMNSLVYGRVCETCNNGWMSKLENETSPLIKDAVRNGDDAEEWRPADCKLVATWAFKTALVLNPASNYRQIVPEKHYADLYMQKEIPQYIVVEVNVLSPKADLHERQGQGFMFHGPPEWVERQKAKRYEGYNITLLMGRLAIRVTYWPGENANVDPDQKMTRLFPVKHNPLSFRNVEKLNGKKVPERVPLIVTEIEHPENPSRQN